MPCFSFRKKKNYKKNKENKENKENKIDNPNRKNEYEKLNNVNHKKIKEQDKFFNRKNESNELDKINYKKIKKQTTEKLQEECDNIINESCVELVRETVSNKELLAKNPITLTPFIRLKGQLKLGKKFDNLLKIYIKNIPNIDESINNHPPKYSENEQTIIDENPPKYSKDDIKLDVNLYIGDIKIPLKEGMNIINLCVCALPFEHICISSNKEIDFQMLISNIELDKRVECIDKNINWKGFVIKNGYIYKSN